MNNRPNRCIMVGVTNHGKHIVDLLLCTPEKFKPTVFTDRTSEVAREEANRRVWKDTPCFGSLQDALSHAKADAAWQKYQKM